MTRTYKDENLTTGTLAYDLAQLSPVVIANTDVGRIEDLSDASRERVVTSNGNRAIGFDDDTRCVDVTYLDLQSVNDRSYTFPETRLGVPIVRMGERDFTPRQHVMYDTLKQVLSEAIRDDSELVGSINSLWRNAGLDTTVLNAAMSAVDEDLSKYTDA